MSKHHELSKRGMTAHYKDYCSQPPTTFDGEPARGSSGYLELASIAAEGLVSLYHALTDGRERTSAAFLLVGHSLPCTHVEAVDIGKKVARACGVDPSVPGNWSDGSCWHSTPSRKARRFIKHGNERHPKARYDANAPTVHAREYMLHCAQHGTYRRADCVQACEQGLMGYDVATSPPVYRGGKWFYESMYDAYSNPLETTHTVELRKRTTPDLAVDALVDAAESAEPPTQEQESLAWAIQLLSERACAFPIYEVQELSEYSYGAVVQSKLERDVELVKLVSSENEEWFISRTMLIRRLISINLRLARIGITRLTEHQWHRTLNSIRLEGQWNSPPASVVEFGSRYCLVDDSQMSGGVVFPLAAVLSCIRDHDYASDDIRMLLASFHSTKIHHDSLDAVVDRFLSSNFAERTVDIVKRREGLHEEHIPTLAELAPQFGLTRARVQQIAAKFWKAITVQSDGRRKKDETKYRRLRKELAHIFLEDLLHQRGSLVWQPTDAGFPYRMFLAKCLGIPTWSFPHIGIVVAGPASEAIARVFHAERLDTSDLKLHLDPVTVSREIASDTSCGLIGRDVNSVAEIVVARRTDRLTKTGRVYLVLRDIGRPAHFSEVAKSYNAMFPDDESSERSIHAALSRYEHGIVWVGRKGTFALSEWGFSQPQKGLYETVTDIVTTEYTRNKEPVRISVIAARLGDSRDSIHPTSLVFITEANADLRYVLGDAFVPRILVDDKPYAEHSEQRGAMSGAQSIQTVDGLSVSSIAGLEFTGKHQRSVVELGKSFSIGVLNSLLRTGIGPTDLARIFDTKGKVIRAEKAISRFRSTRESWTNGRRHDPRATWLLPPTAATASFSESDLLAVLDGPIVAHLGSLPISEIDKLHLACKEIEAKIMTQAARGLDGVDEVLALGTELSKARETLRKADWREAFAELDLWMPFLSLELIQKLKSMKSADHGLIQRVLIRANREVGLSDEVMPWASDFPNELAALPLHWLYQFAPERRLLQSLDGLSSAHCTNVGHLVVFHPTAWNTVRGTASHFWTKLAVTLSCQA